MLEIIAATLLTLIIFAISQFASINNTAIEALVSFVPVIIPTFFMWTRTPRNYLKLMSLKSVNIRYQLDIVINKCFISELHFKEIRKRLLNLDQSNDGRILKESLGELLFTSSLEVDTGIIDLNFDISAERLTIKSKNKIKYKLFFRMAEDLLNEINSVFKSNEGISYNNDMLNIRIKINFIDKKQTDSKNPFWEKLFHEFKNKIVDFRYITKNNTSVLISSDVIEFFGNNIITMGEDISNELTVLRIRN